MKPNPFEPMLANKSYNEVLKAAETLSRKELEAAAAAITDEQIVDIAMYTSTNCRSLGIQETLICGCMLYLFAAAVAFEGRRELYDNMLEDLGVSRTQSFRCRAVWEVFGVVLLQEAMLRKFFSSESLKIMAEDRTPVAARQEALDLARQGERISIKVAKGLQAKHGVARKSEAAVGPARKSAPKPALKTPPANGWLFAGHVVRVRVEPTTTGELASLSDVIRDLEAATEELRQRGSAILMSDTTAA